MDGERVVAAVAQPGRDRDAALRRQDEVELQFALHHGVMHAGSPLDTDLAPARGGPVRVERGGTRDHYAGPEDFLRRRAVPNV
ncbi:hypothetical protein Saso_29690 [Streptomyces asoensis]|uniref:Uncharacterized protein n=1 Tax=Streptomyces asoensis TaxID=249586 RepID=A0ABQ3RZQ2_9ACTN|nr:hypothetical protein GCM10010496_11270 [Streptomyces asoensis]GHI61319.1 hypothetical protein Saso_29690 [Streptomyces asoensis]